MKYPNFKIGERVCFLSEKHGSPIICSGIVNCLLFTEDGWKYYLEHLGGPFPEKDMMDYTEAFGEYYEKYSKT